MRISKLFILTILLLSALTLSAQQPAAGPHLKGRVMDSSGAVIPGSSVKVLQGAKVVSDVMTNDSGDFDVPLAAGAYQLEVTSPDFKAFKQPVQVVPNMAPLSIPMTLEVLSTVVEVQDVSEEVSIDDATSLAAQTIAGDQLQDLPDNEDDLAAYLQQLASTSGAAGSQASFVIDGFNGGRLPPRDQIQQIIIDNNPFSAEGNGGTRIQIITRAGTGTWSGQLGSTFQSSAFNAATPAAVNKPARQQKNFNFNSSGPIIPRILTMTFTGQNSETEAEGNTIRAILPTGTVNNAVISPSTRRNLSTRGQLYLTKANTLNFNVNYGSNNTKNQGVGGFNLAERASNSAGHNWSMQVSERAIPNTSIINELRFQVNTSNSSTDPVTSAIAINVSGAFNGGGGQNSNQSRNRTYQLGDTLRWTLNPKWSLQSGIEANIEKRHSVSQNNFLGTYTFASIDDYLAGHAQTFTQTSGNPLLDSRQSDINAFIQADWRMTSKTSLGLGARYIAQSNLHDYNNLAPTVSLAIQATKKTVIRLGSRVSYQPFSLNNVETLLRSGGTQSTLNIAFPTYIPGQVPLEALTAAASGVNNGSIYVKATDLQAPYSVSSQFSVDQSLPKGFRISNSFDFTRGEHVIRTRNINAPFPGTALPVDLFARLNSFDPAVKTAARAEVDALRPFYPTIGNMYQYEASGKSASKNWTIRLQMPTNVLHVGPVGFGGVVSYTLGYSKDDGGTAPNQYDWTSEWARSNNDQRNRFQSTLNVRLPKNATVLFNINGGSGRPYNVTTGTDLNGDQSTTDRAAGIARNSATAPSTYNVNMSFNKTFYLKRQPKANGGNDLVSSFAEPQFAGGGGQGGFGGGGGQRPDGGGNFPGGGRPDNGQRPQQQQNNGPQLQFSVQVSNLLNNTQVRGVSGVQTSSLFGKATSYAGGRGMTMGLNLRF